ncbi:HNH endonuclease [Alkalibacillus sp. S2W]|uniref:HNH endonuclease n=1 Tax=Alkalibacillus sp. S2W TaxID=3386553 RepID=UPI00398D1C4B
MSKFCNRCGQAKPITAFYGAERSHCADCEKAQKREYHSTMQAKAKKALRDSKTVANKVEQEQGIDVTDNLTLYDVLWVLADNQCAYCAQELAEQERTLDHITPMRYGGSNTLDNITCACLSCNRLKSDTPVLLHYIQRGCNTEEILSLVERMALRQGTTFEQTLSQLNEDVKAYFLRRAEKAGEQLTT